MIDKRVCACVCVCVGGLIGQQQSQSSWLLHMQIHDLKADVSTSAERHTLLLVWFNTNTETCTETIKL